jgi:hypothetical protein
LSNSKPSLSHLAAHNLDAILAVLALPAFLLAGLPLEGWYWSSAAPLRWGRFALSA